jgi:mono/diheme cytochrome c family protein
MQRALFAGVLLLIAAPARADDKPTAEGVEFFEKKIRPLLVKHCYQCHGPDEKKMRGELRLDTRAGVLKGGESGPVIVPGDPAKSLLVKLVRHEDEARKMPPKEKLSDAEVADLAAWIKMGAPDPRTGAAKTNRLDLEHAKAFWAFKPVVRPQIPISRDPKGSENPIDAFILAKLRDKGLSPAPPADRRTLIRRATYDLTGLPPTPEEIDAFLKDDSPDAFAGVVDRLLASPAYGERWGRHWMDVVRYADTAGDNSDYPIPQMYRYRNWVIDAFNRDLPYDEFIRQQLAGDLLPSKDEADRRAKLVATGYLANTKRFGSYEDERYPWYLTYEDTIDNLGRTFLGLTINCCRCHDHKFDPLSQEDYYALYGFFSSTRYPRPGIELDKVQRDFVPLAPPEKVAAAEKERKAKLAELDARVKKLEADKAKKEEIDAVRKERDGLAKKPLPFETAYAVAEGKTEGKKKVGNACVQIKGDPERLGPEVARRFPTVLGGQMLPADVQGSGRVHLANWIADPKNPLTARVMANRIWQYHFGKGIVPTPSNFGTMGQPPTHPELLDRLAAEFVARGWSVKAMHRLIMLSRTYQQSSRDDEANAKIDVGNDYLWRFDRRRLDAESIRDTLLVVGGNLDRTPGGPHPFPAMNTWNFTQHNPFKAVYDTNRRSVYVMTQRFQRHPFFGLFDGADTNASTERRVTSTTPLQALFLMNDPFVHEQAKRFAARVVSERSDDAGRIERAFVLLYGRLPTDEETTAAKKYLAEVAAKLGGGANPPAASRAAWESLARALFLSNEFVYVD